MTDQKSKANEIKKDMSEKKQEILETYIRLVEDLKRNIKMSDINDCGITRDMIKHHFGSLTKLNKTARETSPDKFFDIPVENIYSQKSLASLREGVKSYSKFVITTAVAGCSVNDNFYDSIKTYCEKNNAKLLILVATDPAHTRQTEWGTVDSRLRKEAIVLEDTKLNSNVFLSTIKLSAKHIDPTTGLGRIGQRNGTFVYASPKQRLKAVPTSNTTMPHFMMTTGAITDPDYDSREYMSKRTAYIAENDHVLGALIVEIEDDKIYHFRQIQSNSYGYFYDLGIEYTPEGSSKSRPEAFVLGDWHAGETDPSARKSWFDVSKETKPKRIILHDAFDGLSINHHESHNKILKAKRAEDGQLCLKEELKILARDLDDIAEITDEVVVVKSNHDQFLERYLQEAKYIYDPQNHKLSLQLSLLMLDGKDPLKEHINSLLKPETLKKVRWLAIDEDYIIDGIQCGAHGHLGSNGARGSLRSMEASYGNSVSGHSHTPEILRGAWCVGTSSKLKLEYNKGASSWLHSSCLVYEGGSRQLINSIEGKWKS
jgi:hypothetical protein